VDTIEVRYAGVVVGRTAQVREVGGQGGRMFVGIPEPLPVGTLVTLKIGETVREARVDEVVESAEPSSAGMGVTFDVAAKLGPQTSGLRPQEARGPRSEAPPLAAPQKPAAAPAPEPVAPVAAVPVVVAAPEPSAPAPVPVSDPPSAAVAAESESGAISAPLSLAGSPGGDQHGGGKRRRKRR
jgi:hypothetical protein